MVFVFLFLSGFRCRREKREIERLAFSAGERGLSVVGVDIFILGYNTME